MAHDLIFQDDALQAIFYGNVSAVPNPPSRLVNIFVSSTKTDMEHERRQLHEVVVPNLQREWSSLGVDVQLVDIQTTSEDDAILYPGAVAHQLEDIENCCRTSLGCFFLCLIGNKYRPYPLPAFIEETEYKHLYNAANEAGLEVSLLDNRYRLDSNLIPPRYVLQSSCSSQTDIRKTECHMKTHDDSINGSWPDEEEKLVRIIQYGARIAAEEGLIKPEGQNKMVSYLMSGVHAHLRHALKVSKGDSERILCIVRQFEGIDLQDPAAQNFVDISPQDNSSVDEECLSGLQDLLEDVIFGVNKKNVAFFSIPWSQCGLDTTIPDHSSYLKAFTEYVTNKLNEAVTTATSEWLAKWDIFPPTYRKSVQEVMRESQSQLLNSRRYVLELGVSQSLGSDCGPLLQIQQLMIENDERIRHTPIIVCGGEGCGKSTLISQVVMYCPEWLGGDVIRIVRHVGQSPCSTYTSELLRYLCLHISLVFDFEVSPKHQSFELGKLSIWFQDLLKLVEETPTDLVIVLDDLHELRSPPSNQAAILGWLPWNLPPNVHIVCTISQDAETILGLLKSRMPSGDNFIQIPTLNCASAVSMLQSNLKDRKHTLTAAQMESIRSRLSDRFPSPLYIKLLSRIAERWPSWKETSKLLVPSTLEEVVDLVLSDLKEKYGYRTIRKVATFLACTTYGLRENELVELLASTMESVEDSQKHSFRPASWFTTVKEMKPLLKEYYVDRRPYLHWSHKTISEYIRNRYLRTSRDLQACYAELASAFHLGFLMEKEKDDANSAKDKRKNDWCDILREIDELWFHLLQSADRDKLKQEAVCNFDFLQSAINGSSISYIRSILELVKCQILDWEIELLSAVTKQSVDILSQDSSQLATELLNWLKCFSDGSGSQILSNLITSALRHSNRCTKPLLVPANSWLTLSLPPQVTQMTCPGPVLHMVTTPDSQHAFCATSDKDISMYHLPSKNLERTFKGHKAAVTCLHVTSSGQMLVSGSEDTDVIVWQIDTGQLKQKMSYHISGVLCVTTTNSETLVLSGSEMGVVIVANLQSGEVAQRLEKHRGVINCICVNSGDDIFATGSSDKTVCVWSVEDFALLNCINVTAQIYRMDISRDSTFLVLACDDKSLHVRSLTTGSEVHCLQGAGADVTSVKFANDNCRCVVGCRDGKCHIFDIHSATLITTLSGHTEEVSSVQVQPKDTFLVTSGGNKVVVWNFSTPRREQHKSHTKQKVKRTDSHREPILCIAVSRDGNYAVTGSKDNYLKTWNMATGEVSETMEGHNGPITCVTFSHNGLYVVSGSEDTTVKVWGLTLKQVETTFREHQCKIVGVSVATDNRRVLSLDVQNNHRLWISDTGSQIYVCTKPTFRSSMHGNTVFAVTGKNDNSLKFWSVMDVDNEKTVSHSDAILCYTITYDCQMVVTGSQDMSLKVWEVPSGKLTQVLAGHEGSVTCVAVTPLSPSLVVSGSTDCTLIVWDMLTGSDNFTLRGHTDTVKSVALTPDGSIVISGSSDNTIQIWNTQTGERVGMIDMHAPFLSMATSLNLSQTAVQLANSSCLPILRLHNNPAKSVTVDMLPGFGIQDDTKPYGLGDKGMLPKRVLLRGNLKREQSFDSLYWELKAAATKHDILTTSDDMKKTSAFPFQSGGGGGTGSAGIWDGTKRSPMRPPDTASSQPKAKLAKQKLLKKQQSMFAFFPVHNQQTGSPSARDLESRKADFMAKLQSANRQLEPLKSSDEDTRKNGKDHETDDSEAVISAVCAIT